MIGGALPRRCARGEQHRDISPRIAANAWAAQRSAPAVGSSRASASQPTSVLERIGEFAAGGPAVEHDETSGMR